MGKGDRRESGGGEGGANSIQEITSTVVVWLLSQQPDYASVFHLNWPAPCTSALAPTPPFSPDLMRITHARPLNPAALAFVPFGIVLVRVRVRHARENWVRAYGSGILSYIIYMLQGKLLRNRRVRTYVIFLVTTFPGYVGTCFQSLVITFRGYVRT